MNVKVMFSVAMLMFVTPFIITTFVMEQTKRTLAVYALLLVLFAALWGFGQTSLGAPLWNWLHTLGHVLFVLAACWFLFLLAAIVTVLRRRRRLGRLEWDTQPTQQQFSRSCLSYLRRAGWTPRGRLSRMFIDIERMDRGPQRATFVFTARPFPLEAVRRLMSQTVFRPYGQVVVVSWRDEAPVLQTMMDSMGWRCVSVDSLRAEEEKGRQVRSS